MRFSMLSLTFCSCPESVCMTNHWLGIDSLEFKQHEYPEEDLIHGDGKSAQDNDGDGHNHGGTLQFFPGGPGAFAQFLAGLLHVSGKPGQVTFPPEPRKRGPDDHRPDYDPDIVLHTVKMRIGGLMDDWIVAPAAKLRRAAAGPHPTSFSLINLSTNPKIHSSTADLAEREGF